MQIESNQVERTQKLSIQIGEQIVNLNRVSNKPSASHCGYCDSNGSYSWGLTKQIMHPLTYQLLAERGWRRCGTYYYKPDIKQSCCKLWTHRLDTTKFKIKKDQKKTVRQVVDWLLDRMGQKNKEKQVSILKSEKKMQQQKMGHVKKNLQKDTSEVKHSKIEQQIPQKWIQVSMRTSNILNEIIQERKLQFFLLIQKNLQVPEKRQQFQLKIDISKIKCFHSQDSADSDFYSNHLMVLFGLNKKLFKKIYKNLQFVQDIQNFVFKHLKQSLKDDFLVQIQRSGYLLFTQKKSPKLQRKLKKLLISEKKKLQNQNKQQMKNQMKISESRIKKKKQEKKTKIESNLMQTKFQLTISPMQICFGPLSIQIVPAEVATQSWRMYQRYSTQIHEKAEKSKSSYSGFLCEKALKYVTQTIQSKTDKEYTASWQLDSDEKLSTKIKGKVTKLMGCYHMKYFIQQQLIGVGVVDLFPEGLSSVYFFYQPKYKDYRLGVFSSLVQIQYIRWMSLTFPEFKNYYMGFYIQNSQKMNYKGNYEPFDLMCPITYQFVESTEQLQELIKKIQKKQIDQIQLSQTNTKINDMNFTNDIGVYINQTVKIKYEGKNLSLKDLNPRILITVLGMLRDMAQVWGKFLFEHFTFTF